MRTFANWEEVPLFDSEESEADFWSENRPDLRLMEAATATSTENSESVTVTLRFDPRDMSEIRVFTRTDSCAGLSVPSWPARRRTGWARS